MNLIDNYNVNIEHYKGLAMELESDIKELQIRVENKKDLLNGIHDYINSLKYLVEKEYEKVGK